MRPCISPFENLAAFAIAFCCGAITALSLSNHLRQTSKGDLRGGR